MKKISVQTISAVMAAAVISQSMGAFSAAAKSESRESSKLMLPQAGVFYALSARKVSLKDVEDDLLDRGVIDERKSDEKSLAGAAIAFLLQKDSEEILATDLTPVQTKELTLLASSGSGISGTDAAAASVIAAGAVSVVASDSTVLEKARRVEEARLAGADSSEENETVPVLLTLTKTEDGASADTDVTTASIEAAEESTQEEEAGGETADTAESADSSDTAAAQSLVVSTAEDYVNVRKSPSEDADIVGKLYSGSVGTVTEDADSDGWIHISSGDVEGYVKSDYVAVGDQAKEMAEEVQKQKAVVTTETLRVRAAASVDSDVITLIGKGQELDIIEEQDGWYKVSTDEGEGYISSDFTDVEVWYPEAISKEEEEAQIAEAKAKEEAEAAAAAQKQKEEAAAASVSKGQEVVSYAMQFLGNPYVWGGSSLTNGTDCSGFTMSVYAHFGVSLPHYDAAQRSCGSAVASLSQAQPGDLICYYGHVGIYIGGGQIISASNPRDGIKIQNAGYRQIAAIRRIF